MLSAEQGKVLKQLIDDLVISGGGIPEAPIDGTTYGRKDGAWEAVGAGVVPTYQQVLDENPIASFVKDGDTSETADFQELINNGIDFYSNKSFQNATTQTSESLTKDASYRIANYNEDGVYQSQNQDVVSQINETSGFMNTIRSFFKEIFTSGHTGSVTIQVPTPKTGAGGVNVNIEFPYKETSGTYRIATQDEVVPYTGATTGVDLGNNNLDAKGVKINGTAGAGHVGLKHQSAPATASGSETALYAGSDGELYYKNDGGAVAQIASRAWTLAQGFLTSIADATSSVKGILKLYTSTGSNTDGSMTQKSVTDALT